MTKSILHEINYLKCSLSLSVCYVSTHSSFLLATYFHLLSCDQDLSSVLLGPEQSGSHIHLNSHSHDCVLVTQSRLTLCGPMDCRPPGTVHGILQARRLERVPVLLSRGSSQPQGSNLVYCIAGRFFFTI